MGKMTREQPFRPSLMLASKAGAYPTGTTFRRCIWGYACSWLYLEILD